MRGSRSAPGGNRARPLPRHSDGGGCTALGSRRCPFATTRNVPPRDPGRRSCSRRCDRPCLPSPNVPSHASSGAGAPGRTGPSSGLGTGRCVEPRAVARSRRTPSKRQADASGGRRPSSPRRRSPDRPFGSPCPRLPRSDRGHSSRRYRRGSCRARSPEQSRRRSPDRSRRVPRCRRPPARCPSRSPRRPLHFARARQVPSVRPT